MKGTIKSKEQITALFECGLKFSSASMLALYSPVCGVEQSQGRLAFIAGKKLGNAPLRSRAKRRLRQAAAEQGAPWNGYDVVFVARKGVVNNDFERVLGDMARFSRQLNDYEKQAPAVEASPIKAPDTAEKPIYRQILGFIHDIPMNIALGCINIYRHAISPIFPPSCRYIPTCSEYALEAFRKHGFIHGFGLAVRRVGRCHPWHEGGYDPVPEAKGQR